jgi:GNAT superfamily N-acetyltransferase
MPSSPIEYLVSPPVANDALNVLFASAWDEHRDTDFQPVLTRSMAYVCAFDGQRLVGFVNLAWDGGIHAFLLDTTVHRDYQRRGIGQELVKQAVQAAREHSIHWLHVDYEPHLQHFYESCGFSHTEAGLMRLTP